jgi:glycosyltransferase involved in cell wall biosynthesis
MTGHAVNSDCGPICVVAPLPPPYGGMSLQAEKLISRLKAEGIQVEVVATNPPLPSSLAWAARVPGLRTLIREVQYGLDLLRASSRCRVIHHFSASNLYFFACSAPVVLVGILLRKKVILNYRGGKAAEFLKTWAWCAVPLIRLASAVCVPSEFLQEVFGKWRIATSLLPNIADTETFPWKERDHFAPRLLITRHLEPMYNAACALRAFQTIQQRFPEATFTIAGDGSESQTLHAQVRDSKLSGVRFLGAVAATDLPALYADHDIYLNSSNVDNFPGALVEAACSGLPIVTTGAGGIPFMIKNQLNGIVVSLDDDEALAAGVIDIVRNPSFGRRLARNAREWAEQFSWANVFPRLLAVYGESPSRMKPQTPEVQVLTS